jgi:hypothetical protein
LGIRMVMDGVCSNESGIDSSRMFMASPTETSRLVAADSDPHDKPNQPSVSQ